MNCTKPAPCLNFLFLQSLNLINDNKSFYCLISILSRGISLNPGPVSNHHPPNLKKWDIFEIKRVPLLQLNVNTLLPKTDELRYTA